MAKGACVIYKCYVPAGNSTMSENLNPEPETSSQSIEGANWIYFAAIALIGITTAMLVPAVSSQQLHPLAAYFSIFLATLSFSAIWWYRQKSIWFGAGVGAILGILMFMFAVSVSILV